MEDRGTLSKSRQPKKYSYSADSTDKVSVNIEYSHLICVKTQGSIIKKLSFLLVLVVSVVLVTAMFTIHFSGQQKDQTDTQPALKSDTPTDTSTKDTLPSSASATKRFTTLLETINQMKLFGETYHLDIIPDRQCHPICYLASTSDSPVLSKAELDALSIRLSSTEKFEPLLAMEISDHQPVFRKEQSVIWNIELLDNALRLFVEYQEYAIAEPSSLEPTNPSDDRVRLLFHSAVKERLSMAMTEKIKQAIQSPFTSKLAVASQTPENLINHRLQNFQVATERLLRLEGSFKAMSISDKSQWFILISQQQALSLLDDIMALIQNNRLYQPKSEIDTVTENLLEGLYGMTSTMQLEDYLHSQEQRAEFILFNYALPLVTYLQNNLLEVENHPPLITFSNSLKELNKHHNLRSDNTLADLTDFFIHHLTKLNEQDCEAKLSFIAVPSKNDIFARAHASLIGTLKRRCGNN